MKKWEEWKHDQVVDAHGEALSRIDKLEVEIQRLTRELNRAQAQALENGKALIQSAACFRKYRKTVAAAIEGLASQVVDDEGS